MRNILFLGFVIALTYITLTTYGDQFCDLVNININDPETTTRLFTFGLILALIIFCCYQVYCYMVPRTEGFEAVIGDMANNRVNKIDLENFFQFMEYYQAQDLDDSARPMSATCLREGEMIRIRNAIRNINQMLRFIVNVNDQDNFYHRWMVAKMASNMEWDKEHPRRRYNYDEMVRGNVGSQFTIVPQNQLDLYWPRANLDSKSQSPLPHSISVHDYYSGQNVEVNLLTLGTLIELVQENNPDVFGDIIRPTEHPTFQQEFVGPMKSIIHSMLAIMNTDTYKEYLVKHKFDLKYGSLTFNPHMIRDQFGTF